MDAMDHNGSQIGGRRDLTAYLPDMCVHFAWFCHAVACVTAIFIQPFDGATYCRVCELIQRNYAMINVISDAFVSKLNRNRTIKDKTYLN